MQTQLLSIFKAITPDNIKNIKLISDSMEIFIELLLENSYISADIKEALSENTTKGISEELPKIYLNDYYSMIENLRTNKTIVNKFKRWNDALNPQLYPKGMPIISDKLIVNYFIIGETGDPLVDPNSEDGADKWNISPLSGKLDILSHNILQNKAENYFINRKFKESKGLKKSIQFIYDIVNEYMVNPDERTPLVFEETGRPFEIELISGSMDKDIYNESVAYLAHPLGFTYNYIYISELNFVDNFGLRKYYNIKMLEVRCLNGNVEKYDKNVIYIEEKENYLKIVFFDGTYLVQQNDSVSLYKADDTVIKQYPPEYHCSIYLDYEILYETKLSDSIKFSDKSENIIDIININEDTNYRIYSRLDQNNFLIGISIIGEKYLSDNSDQFEGVKVKDSFISPESTLIYRDNINLLDSIKGTITSTIFDDVEINDNYVSMIKDNSIDSYDFNLNDSIESTDNLLNTDNVNLNEILTTNYPNLIYDNFNSNFISDSINSIDSLKNLDNININLLDDNINTLYGLNNMDNVIIGDVISSPIDSLSEDNINIQNSDEEFDIQII